MILRIIGCKSGENNAGNTGLYNTWTLNWTVDWTMDSQLFGLFHYNITVLLSYICILIQDAPHLNNNMYDKRLVKNFHIADVDDDSDRFYLAS